MDLILEQVAELNTKVDALYRMVNQLNQTMTSMAESLEHQEGQGSHSSEISGKSSILSSHHHHIMGADRVLEHKDVLVEIPYHLEADKRRNDDISPELQTQRLTAQLTAAYNRIAALEEQLLSKRIQ
ncbi:MAG: hypothetical protein VKJ64_17235 [Leptolyngbyaceae bacterium]|nr:hypothetical protein [Leptolyngbyaceae bacterium]